MATKTIGGSYTAGYYLNPTYDTLNIKPGGYVGGTGVTTSATQPSTIMVLGTVHGISNGITLSDGGTITIGNSVNPSALVRGEAPITVNGAAGTINNRATIITTPVGGPLPGGSYIYAGPSILLNAGGTVNNGTGAEISNGVLIGAVTGTGTVVNNGFVGGTATYHVYSNGLTGSYYALRGPAIAMDGGGSVVNGTGGNTSADIIGIVINGSAGSITNNAQISSAVVQTSYYSNFSNYTAYHSLSYLRSVYLGDGGIVGNGSASNHSASINDGIVGYGAPVKVTNNGFIAGPTRYTYLYRNAHQFTYDRSFYSIALYDGGTITNGSANYAAVLSNGIYFANGVGGTVINNGQIGVTETARYRDGATTYAHYGYSIRMSGGGTVVNSGITATISNGISIYGGTGTITNTGRILGSAPGAVAVVLGAGGQITNGTASGNGAGYIGGAYGVYLASGGTLTNFAEIVGQDGFAVYFGAPGRLIEEGSGFLVGAVNGGGGALELAAAGGSGQFYGLGTTAYNFPTVQVDKGATWTLVGPSQIASGTVFTNAGSTTVEGGIRNNGEIDNLAGGSLILIDNLTVGPSPSVGAGLFTNSGTLEKLAGGGTSLVRTGTDTFTSTGVIDVEDGALELTGSAINLSGSIIGTAEFILGPGVSTLNPGVTVNVAEWLITGIGTQVVVARNLAYGGGLFQAAANTELTIDSGDLFNLASSASFLRDTVDGAGRISTAGNTTVALTTLGGTAQWVNNGLITETAQFTLGDSLGDVATFRNATGGTFDLTVNAGIGIGSAPSSTFVNAGLLDKTTGALSTIATSLVNTGTVEVGAGTIDLQNAVTGNGGTFQIDSGQRLQVDSSVVTTQTVDFAGTGDRLTLTDAPDFHAALSNFGAGDQIVLTQFDSTSTIGFVENHANTGGTLTVTDGALQAKIALLGQYMASGFSLNSAGGGEVVTYTAPPEPLSLLTRSS